MEFKKPDHLADGPEWDEFCKVLKIQQEEMDKVKHPDWHDSPNLRKPIHIKEIEHRTRMAVMDRYRPALVELLKRVPMRIVVSC